MKLEQLGGVVAVALVAGSLLWASTTPASAVVLTGGTGATAPDIFGSLAGPVEQNTGVLTLTAPGSFTATYQEEAIADTARGGQLDFILQIKETAGPDEIVRVTTASYTGFATDVGYIPLGTAGTLTSTATTVAPSTVDDLQPSGSVIGFNFGGLPIGSTSDILVIETNAAASGVGTVAAIDSNVASGAGLAPVPAPLIGHGLFVLLAVGGVVFGGKLLEDRKKHRFRAA
jgi:hypothetical protein